MTAARARDARRWIVGGALWLGALAAACGSGTDRSGASGGAGAGTTGSGLPGLPECVGTCEPGEPSCFETNSCGFTMCEMDSDCPATDHQYIANGPRCVAVCGTQRLCRTPCSMGCPMGTTCSAIADDGTEYCEIGLTRCDAQTSCGEFLVCVPSLRPKS
jgi:hypothetical protein